MKRKLAVLCATGLAVLLAGCETMDPYTGESETSKATKGALIGAAAGIAVGLASGDDAVDRRQRALIGAGVGALAGGAVGNYMDRQEAELRAELAGTGVGVTRDGDNITLNMPGNITFATDSADLNSSFFEVLGSVSKVLKEFDQTVIEVAGPLGRRLFQHPRLQTVDRLAGVAEHLVVDADDRRAHPRRGDGVAERGGSPAVVGMAAGAVLRVDLHSRR